MHDRDTNFRMIVVRLPLVTGNGIAVSTTRSIYLVLVERGRAKSSSSIEGKKKNHRCPIRYSQLFILSNTIDSSTILLKSRCQIDGWGGGELYSNNVYVSGTSVSVEIVFETAGPRHLFFRIRNYLIHY